MLVEKLIRTGNLGETDDMALAGVISTQLVYRHFISEFRPPAPLGATDDVKIVSRTPGAVAVDPARVR